MFNWKVVFVLSLLSILDHVDSQDSSSICNLEVFKGFWVENTALNKLRFYRNIGTPENIIEKMKNQSNSMNITKLEDGFNIQFSEYSLEQNDLRFVIIRKKLYPDIELINKKEALVFLNCRGNLFTSTYKINPAEEQVPEKRMLTNEKIRIERMAHSGVMFVRYEYSSDENNIIYNTVYLNTETL
ncbi:uncharacterized protein [Lepeophtheirus salmonis]|uniref:uncharacterized protein isoform X1 n=1 Tax=Lepeophtheirus salmonis TaxID=72036 RepID=UPI001AE998C3|nr:uncharacterized protein LOC121129772 isoform X1 [Lepeophtheirus salmonis]